MKNNLFIILYVFFSSTTIVLSQEKQNYNRQGRYFIGISEGLCWGSFNYHYTSKFLDITNYSGTTTEVDYNKGKNLVFIPYPGIEIGRVGKKGLVSNIDLNWYGTNFSIEQMEGTSTTYYNYFDASNTITNTVTYQTKFNQAQKVRIRYVAYSIGLGYSIDLKERELQFLVSVGDLNPRFLQIETRKPTGSSEFLQIRNRFFSRDGIRYDNFVKLKVNYAIKIRGNSSCNFGAYYLRKISSTDQKTNSMSYNPNGDQIEFENLSFIALYTAFSLDF